jgi:hypothetical protein
MAWEVSFTCDICGTTKGVANHWWMLSYADCPCDDMDQVPQRFSIMPWSVEQSRDGEMRHLCGKGCAMQALERFMTPRTSAAPEPGTPAEAVDDFAWVESNRVASQPSPAPSRL